MINRIIWIVLDSVGIGELPDANKFGDVGADTLGHIFNTYPDLQLKNLQKLGLSNIENTKIPKRNSNPIGAYGKVKELSNGKDTTVGHFEMIGVYTKEPFPTYPNGFPKEVIDKFIKETGCKNILGNKAASGTEIIKELGEEHIKTGYPIIYTSTDSVFQIACCEDIVPLEKLYEYCKIARNILQGENKVARVIARPFIKENNSFIRTPYRRDYSIKPSSKNVLSYMKEAGYPVIAVGKIEDIFDKVGITEAVHTKDNMEGVDKTLEYMDNIKNGIIFTNLVEFDSKWGHRRDIEGYTKGLQDFDERLDEIISKLLPTDLLIINADHGCDPAYKGTDHTREYIPLLMYNKEMKKGINLHVRQSFADIGQTICDIFQIKSIEIGESMKDIILQ